MKQPIVIGIPGNILTQEMEDFDGLRVAYVLQGFIDGLVRAGAVPLILPLADESIVPHYVNQVDAILLAGGQDIAPYLYNEEPHQKIGEFMPERDGFESAITKEAWDQNKPILGICRGMQLLNVLFGGTLYQDLSDFDSPLQHLQTSKEYIGTHSVDLSKGSWLSGVFGENYRVNSYHHQAIKKLAKDFRAVARSKDGLIEGIEHEDPTRKVFGVQWHPEMMVDHDPIMQSLFDAFVQLVKNEKENNVKNK